MYSPKHACKTHKKSRIYMPQFLRTLLEVLKSVTLYFNAIYCSFKACSTCEFACLSSMMLEIKLWFFWRCIFCTVSTTPSRNEWYTFLKPLSICQYLTNGVLLLANQLVPEYHLSELAALFHSGKTVLWDSRPESKTTSHLLKILEGMSLNTWC